MSNQAPLNKLSRVLIPFSGGMNSTYLLYKTLLEDSVTEVVAINFVITNKHRSK